MRLSQFALSLGVLGVLGSILMVVFAQALSWKTLQLGEMNLLQYFIGGLNVFAFVLAMIAFAVERDSASGKIAWRCFVLLLVAAVAAVFAIVIEIARHPV